MAKAVLPALNGIQKSFTKSRLGDLYDAALAAYQKALPAQRATPANDAANAALDKIFAKADWWKAPDIEQQIVNALAQGYGDALHESAEEIQGALYHAGLVPSAQVGFAAQSAADPETLALLEAQAGDMIRNIDEGTRFYVKQAVIGGVKEGLGSPAIARGILIDGVRRGVIEKFRGRALSIVNTEMNKAMSGAALKQQQHIGLTKKVWHAVPALACDICLGNADYGPVPNDFVYDDVFEGCTAPPAHPNVCLTGNTRVVAQGIAAATKRWYKGELIILRTAGGHDLRCTPNHPILTDGGWVPAGLLVEGGNVVSSLGRERMPSGHEHDYDVPARIEEIADALVRSGKMAARKVPIAAEDFHGDGVGSKIAIVYADCLLGDDVQTVRDQHGCELRLCRRHRQLAGLNGQRGLDQRVPGDVPTLTSAREALASHGLMGTSGQSTALLDRAPRIATPLGFAGTADLHAASPETGLQRIAAYAVPRAEAMQRIAGQVALDKIVHVDRIADWRGHVYNLQTADGFYVADGIITHNCHCWITFEHKELVDLALTGGPEYLTGG